jgi:DNA-binding beta-propeller fold protein YncE
MPSSKLLVLLAAALAGCGGSRSPATFSIDTLPNGSLVVRSSAPRWKPGEEWKVTQDLAIGGADSGPADLLDVRGITADASGRIYILDLAASAVQVFDASGAHVRTIGRKGGGPGEFTTPIGLALVGSQLLVVDQSSQRLSLFDSTGTLITTHPRVAPANIGVGFWQGGIDRNGTIIETFPVMEEGNPWGRWSLTRLDSAYRATDTVPIPQFEPRMVELVKKSGGGTSTTRMVLPNTPMLAWALDPSGAIWFGVSDHYTIVQRRFDGDTARTIERAWSPPPLSDSAKARAARWLERVQSQGFTVFESQLPTTAPAFQSLVVDDHGNLWVGDPTWPARRYEVFDSTGVLLGPVEFPAPVSQLTFAHDHYYAVTRDEDDVVRVVRGTVRSER